MKFSITLAIALITTAAYSQKVDSIFHYSFLDNFWKITSRHIYYYNNNCLEDSVVLEGLDFNGTTWHKVHVDRKNYDSEHRVIYESSENWNSNILTYASRGYYKFNSVGLKTSQYGEEWNGTTWNKTGKGIFSYNDLRQLKKGVGQTYIDGMWTTVNRRIYNYDSLGQLTEELIENFDNGFWKTYARTKHIYSADKLTISDIGQTYNSVSKGWINGSKTISVYKPNGVLVESMTDVWKGGKWVHTGTRVVGTVDSQGRLAKVSIQNWDEKLLKWQNFIRTSNYYNKNDSLSLSTNESWQGYNNTWQKDAKDRYSYSTNCYIPKMPIACSARESEAAILEPKNKFPNIAPNPATTFVKLTTDNISSFALYNSIGVIVRKGILNPGENILSIQNLSRGVYFIKITANTGAITRKKISFQ